MVLTAGGKPPLSYWIISGLFLIWGLIGCFACYTQLTISPADLAKLPPAQQDAFTSMPGSIEIAYVAAVVLGTLGAALLLMRNRLATMVFVVSLIAVIIQFGWVFGPYQALAKLGPSAAAFPAFIILIGVIEIWFARRAAARGWVR